MISFVQAKQTAFASSAAARTLTPDAPTTAGNLLILNISAAKAGAAATTFTVTDSAGNTWVLARKVTGSKNTDAIYYCIGATSASSIIVTPDTAAGMTITLIEGHGSTNVRGNLIASSIVNDAAIELAGADEPGAFLIAGITHEGPIATVIGEDYNSDGFTSAGKSENVACPSSVVYKAALTGAESAPLWAFDDGETTAVACGITVSFKTYVPVPAPETDPSLPTPTGRWDVRDFASFTNDSVFSLPEHAGGSPAVTNGTATLSTLVTMNDRAVIAITSGVIDLPITGQIGTLAILLKVVNNIVGANDVGDSIAGAFYVKYASNTTTAAIRTDAGSTDGNIVTGAGVGQTIVPVVVMLTHTGDGKALLRLNGVAWGNVTLSGASLAATAVKVFGNYASGVLATGSGTFIEARHYATALTNAQQISVSEEMYNSGSENAAVSFQPLSKRYRKIAFDDATSTPVAGESANGTTWTNWRPIAFQSNLSTSKLFRDASRPVYSGGTYYVAFTQYNFSNHGATFGIIKSTDFAKWTLHTSVDVSAVVNAGTQNAWAPEAYYLANGTFGGFTFHHGGGTNKVHRVPVIDLAAGTFDTPVLLDTTGANSDSFLLAPGAAGNPNADKWRLWTSSGYQDADDIDGPYNTVTSIDTTGDSNEARQILVLDSGTVLAFACGSGGTVYFTSTDDGETWSDSANPTQTIGELTPVAPYNVGQGGIVDLKPLGLWGSGFQKLGRITLQEDQVDNILPESMRESELLIDL